MVSIIIPVFNAAEFLEKTIQSVFEQTYVNWELIIVDDGSTDGSALIAKGCLTDNRVQYFFKANSGVSDSRNFGADKAQGKYLCFLDADDLFYADNLQEKVTFLESNPEYPLVHADVEIIDVKGAPIGEYFKGKGGDVIKDMLLWQQTVIPGPSSIMVTRDAFYKVGEWDVLFSTAADQDFFFRIAKIYHRIGYVSKVLTGYRVLANSMSRNMSVMEKDHIGVYIKALKNGFFGSYWFKQQCFSNLYLTLAGSWYANGNNKKRAVLFLFWSVLFYPPAILKLLKKISKSI